MTRSEKKRLQTLEFQVRTLNAMMGYITAVVGSPSRVEAENYKAAKVYLDMQMEKLKELANELTGSDKWDYY